MISSSSNLNRILSLITTNRLKNIITTSLIKATHTIAAINFNPLTWGQDYVDNSYYFAQDYTEEV